MLCITLVKKRQYCCDLKSSSLSEALPSIVAMVKMDVVLFEKALLEPKMRAMMSSMMKV